MVNKIKGNGFTLIELAIVMIIIGLVVAGIISGREMIENSKLHSLGQEFQAIRIAVENFKGKYKYLPGDLPKGVTYGMSFDGDGDGLITNIGGEGRRVFVHLGASGLIKYNPYPGASYGIHRFEQIENSGFVSFRANLYQDFLANVISYGYTENALSSPTGLLTSDQAYRLDLKIDDGDPDGGWVYHVNGNSCVDGATTADMVDFVFDNQSFACVLYIIMNPYDESP